MMQTIRSLCRGVFGKGCRSGGLCAHAGDACRLARPATKILLGAVGVAWLTAAAAANQEAFRSLAPGVLTVIPADTASDDAIQRGPLVEVTEGLASLRWEPTWAARSTTLLSRAEWLEYPRDIWCLEFAFKPPRTIAVDIPANNREMRRVNVLYMVYRVKNLGGRRIETRRKDTPGEADPLERTVERFEKPVRFLPQFVLETREGLSDAEGISAYRAYLDRVVPAAMAAIRLREDPARELLDSVAISATEIPPGEERWGVAIWEAIDPRIDYFSIYVRGLTNAIRWQQLEQSRIAPDDPPGRHIEQTLKSLRLDFWRPGDAAGEKIAIGHRGMFERMALGGRLLAALGWPGHTSSRPPVGLERLGLAWDSASLREPAGTAGASLLPLLAVFEKLAAIDDADKRSQAARDLFGDLGVQSIEELARAAAGPVDPEPDQKRRQALATMRLSPEEIESRPLESLAKITRNLESAPDTAARRALAVSCFGPAAPRIDWLGRAVILARTLATLDATDADPVAIARLDARGAFETAADAVMASPEPAQKSIQEGLFGPEGPALFAEALEVHEGQTYSWGFRYED